VAVCFKPGVRDALARLIRVRKSMVPRGKKPRSIVEIVDEAIKALSAQIQAKRKVHYVIVPATGCDRLSLRVNPNTYEIAQQHAVDDDVRATDFIRTAVTFYLKKCEKETGALEVQHRR
jgi:hypothetical protein